MTGINRKACKWSEPPEGSTEKETGRFIFTISEDGKSFTGKWNSDSEGIDELDNNWSGVRLRFIRLNLMKAHFVRM